MVNEFPDWANANVEMFAKELPRMLEASEAAVGEIEAKVSPSYEELVWGLDDATRELWQTWGMVGHLLGVANTEELRKLEEEFQPRLVAFSLRVGQSKKIYEAAKGLLGKMGADAGVRRRILEKMVQGAELAGVGLDGEKRKKFNEIQAKVARLSADFANAVIDATTPDIADAVYVEAMKHNPDRGVREALYRKRSTRAAEVNAPRIPEILALRKECAALLGYGNYAELSLKSKSAPSVEAVMKMIDELDVATEEIAKKEEAALGADVAPWDVTYLAERLREKTYAYSEDELKKYFEFEEVLAGLFRLVKFLFGVDVKEVKEKPSVWHKDVRFFAVEEGGKRIAHFYLDPYARPGTKQGGAWMNEFRNRSVRGKGEGTVLPLAVVVLNQKAPDENGKTLMPMREVETLFHEFGHALQCMLTRVDEEDAAGINLVEWDAVEVASQFMENWCLDERTGIRVPEELKAKVKAAKNFRAATACRRQLAFAKTDMELHLAGGSIDANGLKEKNFAHFGLGFVKEDRFLCAFTHIFAGGYAAGYYGYKWAEVMSADLFGAFEEAGLQEEAQIKGLGARYRETILAMGGSQNALEVFKLFRGRGPEIAALIRQMGLK